MLNSQRIQDFRAAVKRAVAAPIFEGDLEKTRRARVLALALNALLIGLPMITIGNLMGGRTPTSVIGGGLILIGIYAALRWLLKRGYVDQVAVIAIGVISFSITLLSALLGTIRTPTTLAYVLLVIIGGMLFQRRGLLILIGISSLQALLLIIAERAGWLPAPDLTVTVTQWVSITVYLVLGGVVTYHSIGVLQQALQRADAELAERTRVEATLHTITDNIREMVTLIDADGLIQFASPSYQSQLGYAPAELVGRSALEFTHPDDVAALAAKFQGALQSRSVDELIEFRCRHAAGHYIHVEATAQMLYTADRISGLVTVFRDISARRQTEQQLRQLSRAVEASPTSIVITDATGAIEYVNPQFTQVTGYTFAEAYGQNPRILKTLQTPPNTHRQLWRTINAGETWRGEFCNRRKDGGIYWEWATISPIIEPATRRITHFVAVKEDITARKQLEATLLRQNATLSTLHHVTLDILQHRAVDELLNAIVQHATELLDAPLGEVMVLEGDELVVRACSPMLDSLTGERTRSHEAQLSWQAVFTRQPAVCDDYATWPQHRTLYDPICLHAVADFPILNRDRCLGVLGLARTQPGHLFTTEQIQTGQLFAQLAALALDNAQLLASAQHEVHERRQAEESLRLSNIDLQARNEELDAYAHTVAHDLKNPLGALIGFSDMLYDSYDDLAPDLIRPSLDAMREGARKAVDIVDALLLLVSIRKQDVRPEPIELPLVIHDVLQRLQGPINATHAVIGQPDEASWPRVLGYRPWIEAIWINLITNALKYGGQPPRIQLSAAVQPDGFIRCAVRDEGPGLTPEQQSRLFTPFEQLEQSRATGHGLGLSIVRRIVDKLGGQVGVDSWPGQGSTFYFTLPAA